MGESSSYIIITLHGTTKNTQIASDINKHHYEGGEPMRKFGQSKKQLSKKQKLAAKIAGSVVAGIATGVAIKKMKDKK